ncbi:MAG: hypothetical protein KDD84_23130, partial [Caldilineaceae bacterium]|nr:hypothetical protein [Caldilineaceae bacterium]
CDALAKRTAYMRQRLGQCVAPEAEQLRITNYALPNKGGANHNTNSRSPHDVRVHISVLTQETPHAETCDAVDFCFVVDSVDVVGGV